MNREYMSTVVVIFAALINIPGIISGNKFSIAAFAFCFLASILSAIINTKTIRLKKRREKLQGGFPE